MCHDPGPDLVSQESYHPVAETGNIRSRRQTGKGRSASTKTRRHVGCQQLQTFASKLTLCCNLLWDIFLSVSVRYIKSALKQSPMRV